MKDFVRDAAVSQRQMSIAGQISAFPIGAAAGIGASAPDTAARTVPFANRYRMAGKRMLDISLVLLSLPITAPVIALCALALLIESGLPFYTQYRLGRMGRRFKIVKLRTMVRDADAVLEDYLARDPALRAEWDETQKLKNDPRITRVGAFLRATSIDELPQIWNVLVGDMSLVGPRPMMPEQLSMYGDPRAYFSLHPGITGTWQVSARNNHSFETRQAYDAAYYAYHDFAEDLQIMWKTVFVMLRRTGY